MRSEKWSTNCERMKVLKVGAAGPVLQFENGECWSFDGEGHVMILGVSGSGKSRRGTIPMTKSFIRNRQSAVIADAKGEIYMHTKKCVLDYNMVLKGYVYRLTLMILTGLSCLMTTYAEMILG